MQRFPPSHSLRASVALILGLLSSLLLLSLGSCAYRHEKTPATNTNQRQVADAPSFAQVKAQVFGPRCTSCHTGYHVSDFVDYASTFAKRDDIRSHAFVIRDMPKEGGPLNDAQAALLQKWLDAGAPLEPAPQSTGEPTPNPTVVTPQPSPTLETLEPTWENVQTHFFKPYCTKCHSGSTPEGDLDLTVLAQVRAKSSQIVRRSLLLPEGDEDAMPPSRRLRAKITPQEKLLLINWLEAGSPGPATQPEPTSSPLPSPVPASPAPQPTDPSPSPSGVRS